MIVFFRTDMFEIIFWDIDKFCSTTLISFHGMKRRFFQWRLFTISFLVIVCRFKPIPYFCTLLNVYYVLDTISSTSLWKHHFYSYRWWCRCDYTYLSMDGQSPVLQQHLRWVATHLWGCTYWRTLGCKCCTLLSRRQVSWLQ